MILAQFFKRSIPRSISIHTPYHNLLSHSSSAVILRSFSEPRPWKVHRTLLEKNVSRTVNICACDYFTFGAFVEHQNITPFEAENFLKVIKGRFKVGHCHCVSASRWRLL